MKNWEDASELNRAENRRHCPTVHPYLWRTAPLSKQTTWSMHHCWEERRHCTAVRITEASVRTEWCSSSSWMETAVIHYSRYSIDSHVSWNTASLQWIQIESDDNLLSKSFQLVLQINTTHRSQCLTSWTVSHSENRCWHYLKDFHH